MQDTYELVPKHDARQSFHGKALVEVDNDGRKYLTSYGTLVCYLGLDGNLHRLWPGWSSTTGRHVREFARQCGLTGDMGKKAWESLEVENLSEPR